MEFKEYQEKAMSLRLPSADAQYARENLVGEVGEYFGLRAKARRDGEKSDHRQQTLKELGDILWQFTAVVVDEGYTLSEVAEYNLEKLFSRKDRGVLGGSGNDR